MRRDSEESRVEGSIPVQARVNIKNLANLDLYWASERYQIRTMSQLIGFSMELLCEILESNGKIVDKIETVAKANQYLNERGLYQQSLKDRSFKKIGMAIAFENMREEGADPKFHAPEQYNRVHRKVDTHGNPSTVQSFTGRVRNQRVSQEMIDVYNNLKNEDVKPLISQEYAMRDRIDEIVTKDGNTETVVSSENAAEVVSRLKNREELPPMKERGNDPYLLEKRIKAADEASQETLDTLKNMSFEEMMKGAVKDKIVE